MTESRYRAQRASVDIDAEFRRRHMLTKPMAGARFLTGAQAQASTAPYRIDYDFRPSLLLFPRAAIIGQRHFTRRFALHISAR